MTHPVADWLSAYDAELRADAEVLGADSVDHDGPLVRARFAERRGFVTYRSLGALAEPGSEAALDHLIERTVSFFHDHTDVDGFEWKTRGHDLPVDLGDRLHAHGLVAEELETMMMGRAADLASAPPVPEGVTLRRIGVDAALNPLPTEQTLDDVRRMQHLQAVVFGIERDMMPDRFARRLHDDPRHIEAWIAEAGGEVVATGRLEIVPGTRFAGLWGGATRPDWRGRGVYRALTAARAASAVGKGVDLLYSDCTEFSRPILERHGMAAVTTTTPYQWTRSGG